MIEKIGLVQKKWTIDKIVDTPRRRHIDPMREIQPPAIDFPENMGSKTVAAKEGFCRLH